MLLVLFYHAKIGGLTAGYLGVDIFYVISGYLITGLIARQIDVKGFSFVRFYISRARRLLPAAYVVYLATAIGAYFLLTSVEYDRFQGTLIGAITFTANIDLWQSTNYFSPAAKFNPLTHTWSLSIEEQYYLLLPFVLVFVPRRFWIAGTIFVLATSLFLCLYLSLVSPAAAFYLLPTRAWELAVGSLIALAGFQISQARVAIEPIKYLALACLLFVPAFAPGVAIGSLHPGLDSIIVSLAAGFLLIAPFKFLETGQVAKILTRFGDISYSLYLVHWPLFAFAYNTYLGEIPPVEVRLFLLIVSLILAYVLFRLIETPTRHIEIKSPTKALIAVVVASIAIILLSFGLQSIRDAENTLSAARDRNFGFDRSCTIQPKFKDIVKCRNSITPNMLVWGDSFAMHLVPGLASSDTGIIQATRASCGPILGLATFRPKYSMYEDWANKCIAYNNSVFEFLATKPDIETVILSSPFHYYLKPKTRGLNVKDGNINTVNFDETLFTQALTATVSRIRSLGKRVVIIGPTPTSGFNIGLCLERRSVGLISHGSHSDCKISRASVDKIQGNIRSLLNVVAEKSGGGIIDLSKLLCKKEVCPTTIEGTPLYLDGHHFSVEGSKAIAKKFSLITHILTAAK